MENQITFFRGNGENNPTREWQVAAGATAIESGWPAIVSSGGVIIAPDASPVIGTHVFAGFSNGESSQTASVAGTVDLYVPSGYQVLLLPAKTPANIDTQAEYDALVNHHTLFDLTAGVYTIDESANNTTYGLTIVDLDVNAFPGFVAFIVRASATWLS